MDEKIIENIRQSLVKKIDKKYKEGCQNYFKEKIVILGVRIPEVRKISSQYFPLVKQLPKKEIWIAAERLIKSEYSEEKMIGFNWLSRCKKIFEESDFEMFEKIIFAIVSDWALCDDFCGHVMGVYFDMFPETTKSLNVWAKSENRWPRRASAVSLIYLVRKGKCFDKALEIADLLIGDEDDLVRKGLGWLLREGWSKDQKYFEKYITENKNKFARVTLRYAIEKMDLVKRKELMVK